MMNALYYTMDNRLVHLCHAGLYPEAKSTLSAALLNIGYTSFVNFTILLEKLVKSVVFSVHKHPRLQFLATDLLCIMFFTITN